MAVRCSLFTRHCCSITRRFVTYPCIYKCCITYSYSSYAVQYYIRKPQHIMSDVRIESVLYDTTVLCQCNVHSTDDNSQQPSTLCSFIIRSRAHAAKQKQNGWCRSQRQRQSIISRTLLRYVPLMASAFVSPVTFVHPTRRVELFGNILYRQVVKNIVDVMMERLKMQD